MKKNEIVDVLRELRSDIRTLELRIKGVNHLLEASGIAEPRKTEWVNGRPQTVLTTGEKTNVATLRKDLDMLVEYLGVAFVDIEAHRKIEKR